MAEAASTYVEFSELAAQGTPARTAYDDLVNALAAFRASDTGGGEALSIAKIIDPAAFTTLRELASAKGRDAANPPAGVNLGNIDEPMAVCKPHRAIALDKAARILAALSTSSPIQEEKEAETWSVVDSSMDDPISAEEGKPIWDIHVSRGRTIAYAYHRNDADLIARLHNAALSPTPIRATGEGRARLEKLAQRLEWGGVGENSRMPSKDELADAKALRAMLAASPLRGEGSQNNSSLPPIALPENEVKR